MDTAPRDGTPLDLNNPTFKREILLIRDELRRFHELKERQKTLEDEISQAQSSDSTTQVSLVPRLHEVPPSP